MELKIGAYALPLIMSLILRWIYNVIGEDKLSNRAKSTIPVVMGVVIALLYIFYAAEAWTAKNILEKVLYGIIDLGFVSIGFYEVTKRTAPA